MTTIPRNTEVYMRWVEAGADKLTDYFGDESWKGRLRPDDLRMGHCEACVIGQTFGLADSEDLTFGEVLAMLDIDDGDAWEFGFDTGMGPEYNFGDLKAAWLEYLGSSHE